MRKAVILAAGRGKRMGSLTRRLPKPMLPVKGRPLLEHILGRMREAGFEQVLIVTGYLAETIESHFASYPLEMHFKRQEERNGTAKAALLARDFAGTEPFLLTFGDILVQPDDYRNVAEPMKSPEMDGVVAVKHVADPYQGAAVYAQGARITKILEKPQPGTSTTNWNSAGLYAFRESLFDALLDIPLSERREYELTSAISEMLLKGKYLRLYEVGSDWRDVGRPEDLRAADSLV